MIERLEELDIETFPMEDSGAQLLTLLAHINETKRKINELVDAVNELKEHIKFLDERIKTKNFMVDIDKTNPVSQQIDPYAEQQKWIGKLCKFWDYDGEEKWFSILELIDKNSPYSYCASGDWWYKHCEPVKPDDDVIYKGE